MGMLLEGDCASLSWFKAVFNHKISSLFPSPRVMESPFLFGGEFVPKEYFPDRYTYTNAQLTIGQTYSTSGGSSPLSR